MSTATDAPTARELAREAYLDNPRCESCSSMGLDTALRTRRERGSGLCDPCHEESSDDVDSRAFDAFGRGYGA